MMEYFKKNLSLYSFFDYLALALVVTAITIQPYFKHGAINFHETGLYLPCIDAIFKGEIPYRDIFILRGPFEIYIPAFFMLIFGKSIVVLRAYFYIGTILTLIIAVFLGKQFYRLRIFTYFMALVLIAKTFPRVNFANWGGIRFGVGFLALLLTVLFLKRERFFYILLAGIVTGIGIFLSFEIGLFSLLSVVVTLLLYRLLGFSKKSKALILFLSGISIVVFPYLFYLFYHGALFAYFDTLFKLAMNLTRVFDVPSVQGTPRNFQEFIAALSPFNHNIKYMPPFFLYAAMSAYYIYKFLKQKITRKDIMISCIFIYGVLMFYSAFRDLEGPQYEMALQPAIILLYVFLEDICILLQHKKYRVSVLNRFLIYILIAIVPVFSIVYPFRRYRKRFFIFKYAKQFFIEKKGRCILFPDDSYSTLGLERAKGIIVPSWQKEELEGVSHYIEQNTDPEDILFTYPDVGTYNFLVSRPSLGRFKTAMSSWTLPEWHRELMDSLKIKRPHYVIIKKRYPEIEPYLPKVKQYTEELYAYLRANYTVVRNVGNIDIYKINE